MQMRTVREGVVEVGGGPEVVGEVRAGVGEVEVGEGVRAGAEDRNGRVVAVIVQVMILVIGTTNVSAPFSDSFSPLYNTTRRTRGQTLSRSFFVS